MDSKTVKLNCLTLGEPISKKSGVSLLTNTTLDFNNVFVNFEININ